MAQPVISIRLKWVNRDGESEEKVRSVNTNKTLNSFLELSKFGLNDNYAFCNDTLLNNSRNKTLAELGIKNNDIINLQKIKKFNVKVHFSNTFVVSFQYGKLDTVSTLKEDIKRDVVLYNPEDDHIINGRRLGEQYITFQDFNNNEEDIDIFLFNSEGDDILLNIKFGNQKFTSKYLERVPNKWQDLVDIITSRKNGSLGKDVTLCCKTKVMEDSNEKFDENLIDGRSIDVQVKYCVKILYNGSTISRNINDYWDLLNEIKSSIGLSKEQMDIDFKLHEEEINERIYSIIDGGCINKSFSTINIKLKSGMGEKKLRFRSVTGDIRLNQIVSSWEKVKIRREKEAESAGEILENVKLRVGDRILQDDETWEQVEDNSLVEVEVKKRFQRKMFKEEIEGSKEIRNKNQEYTKEICLFLSSIETVGIVRKKLKEELDLNCEFLIEICDEKKYDETAFLRIFEFDKSTTFTILRKLKLNIRDRNGNVSRMDFWENETVGNVKTEIYEKSNKTSAIQLEYNNTRLYDDNKMLQEYVSKPDETINVVKRDDAKKVTFVNKKNQLKTILFIFEGEHVKKILKRLCDKEQKFEKIIPETEKDPNSWNEIANWKSLPEYGIKEF